MGACGALDDAEVSAGDMCMREPETMHLDKQSAFQNCKLYDIVYVAQPGELDDNSGREWKLKKALYGLK